MKTDLNLVDKNFSLQRYPSHMQHPSLQAWDAADELIIEYLHSPGALEQGLDNAGTLICNDSFGALACFLANDRTTWYSDSKVAEKGMLQNWSENQGARPVPQVSFDLARIEPSFSCAILKLPKSNEYLIDILCQLRRILADGTLVITGGKANQISKNVLKTFEKYLGGSHTSLAKKKARLIFTRVNKGLKAASPYPISWKTDDSKLTIINHANTFANQKLDIGARFFLQHLPNVAGKTVIDLGCGNGVLSVQLLKQIPKQLTLVDESAMALQSAKATIEENYDANHQITGNCDIDYCHSNCLEDFAAKDIDYVICNPPFHQQNTITDHIAWQMFKDAHRVLRVGGELRIVGNRHLNYQDKLKRLFGGYKIVASNNKFVILSSYKK